MPFKRKVFSLAVISFLLITGCTGHEKAPTPEPKPAPPASSVPPSHQQTPSPQQSTPGDKPAPINAKNKALVLEIKQRAQQGKILHYRFICGKSLIDSDVHQALGNPDTTESAGKGIYDTYKKQGLAFGFNHGLQIFDIRSYSAEIQKLTYRDITETLGRPSSVNSISHQKILVYKVNSKYQLKFIFNEPISGSTHLDHYSVFYPPAAVNNMAG
ncbi:MULTISPECIES: YjgB family protein [Thermoactinomyces]|jgi:hypothetical protein|uniref:YjgB family protein n=1 Tax=Thermoactinomyces daqus TaxID=1329516 RepID=A0A7W2AJ13_9BACL|nr:MULTISPECIES: YjgB family protein [Thermoactinomyces]MBA4543299.1 YjgB family protein [Thermoactinomyces daqus]MBH8604715.1 YjgB family protein [Thermoactinomyces sp. CICC 10522]MBH8606824.1 YjgB family protein [Thermoactinomyces sp. CICC 10521]